MTREQAIQNIGKKFKIDNPGSGLLHKWDVLRSVENDGTIRGKFLSGHCSNFRLKNSIPDQLRAAEGRHHPMTNEIRHVEQR